MTVITELTTPAAVTRGGQDRGRFAGIAFGVTFLAATLLWGLGVQVFGSDLQALQAESADDTTRTLSLLLSHLIMPLAAAFLLLTVARLRAAIDLAAGHTSVSGQVAYGAAVVMAVGFCLLAAAQHAAILVAGGGYIDGFPADPAVGYGIALLGGNFGNATVWGAGVMMIAVGMAAWRSRLISRWLIWGGFVTSPLLIVGWYYGIPVLLLCVWVAMAGLTVTTDQR